MLTVLHISQKYTKFLLSICAVAAPRWGSPQIVARPPNLAAPNLTVTLN